MEKPAESQSDSVAPLAAEVSRLGVGVVIPAYNPGAELTPFLDELVAAVGPGRVVVIDDGSERTDPADFVCPGAVVVRVDHGGKGWALQRGFDEAKRRGWQWAITMDADGQHAPADLPAFLQAIDEDVGDIILGDRMGDVERMPWLRLWTNRSTSRVITRLAGQPIPDAQSGYRAVRLAILDAFVLETKNFDLESEILLQASWAGFRVATVPIQTIYSGDEHSHIHKVRDTLRFLRLVRKARRWRRQRPRR